MRVLEKVSEIVENFAQVSNDNIIGNFLLERPSESRSNLR